LEQNNLELTILHWLSQQAPETFVVQLRSQPGRETRLSLWLDTDTGIGIDQCAILHRDLYDYLQQQYPGRDFRLEVSSPGATAWLVNPRQYLRHVGRELEIYLHDETVLVRYLAGVQLDAQPPVLLLLPVPEKSLKNVPSTQPEATPMPLADIAKARVKLPF
jgi:ribosome maturation factor RimP